MLRPETVESLFIAYRLTGDELYREHGWKIFQSIEKHAKVPSGGYATVLNVDQNPAELEDKMETFFLVRSTSISLYVWDDEAFSDLGWLAILERDLEISVPPLLRLEFVTVRK